MKKIFSVCILIVLVAMLSIVAVFYGKEDQASGEEALTPVKIEYSIDLEDDRDADLTLEADYSSKSTSESTSSSDTNGKANSSSESSTSNSTSNSGSKKNSYITNPYKSYDEGYEAIYEDDDYDWDRYYSDSEYADGVDDAISEMEDEGYDW